jgi:hypothetical protein
MSKGAVDPAGNYRGAARLESTCYRGREDYVLSP